MYENIPDRLKKKEKIVKSDADFLRFCGILYKFCQGVNVSILGSFASNILHMINFISFMAHKKKTKVFRKYQ